MNEWFLFNLPVPVTLKRLAAAFLVFNLGILFPFNKLELNNKLSGMPIRPNNSDRALYNAYKF